MNMSSTNKKYKLGLLLAVLLLLLVLPNFVGPFYQFFLAQVIIYGLLSTGFNIIYGYAGLFNFGMAVFMGLGGYAVLLSVLYLNANLWTALIINIVGCGIFSLIYGFLVARFKSHYFVVFTIAVATIFHYMSLSLRSITGGDQGLTFPRPPLTFGFVSLSLSNTLVMYYFVLVIAVMVYFLVWRFFRSPYGKAIVAVKENSDRALMIGYNAANLKLVAFTLSGIIGSLAGGLYALLVGFSSAHSFFWLWSGKPIIWTVVGGVGTMMGPFIGTTVMVFAEDLISTWNPDVFPIAMGVIMIVVIILAPGGIVGGIKTLLRRWR